MPSLQLSPILVLRRQVVAVCLRQVRTTADILYPRRAVYNTMREKSMKPMNTLHFSSIYVNVTKFICEGAYPYNKVTGCL